MTDLLGIINELNRRREMSSLISIVFVVKMLEGLVQELQKERESAMLETSHLAYVSSHVTAEVLQRVIGSEAHKQ